MGRLVESERLREEAEDVRVLVVWEDLAGDHADEARDVGPGRSVVVLSDERHPQLLNAEPPQLLHEAGQAGATVSRTSG